MINVVLNDDPTLFQQCQCLDTAIYCGWYSLEKYIDAFKWTKGSVGDPLYKLNLADKPD